MALTTFSPFFFPVWDYALDSSSFLKHFVFLSTLSFWPFINSTCNNQKKILHNSPITEAWCYYCQWKLSLPQMCYYYAHTRAPDIRTKKRKSFQRKVSKTGPWPREMSAPRYFENLLQNEIAFSLFSSHRARSKCLCDSSMSPIILWEI